MTYYYRPTVTALAPAGNSGKVILSAFYQATNAQPSTRAQVEDTVPHADGMPSESVFLRLDPRMVTPEPKYIRTFGLPAGGSLNDFDGGFVNVSFDATASPGPCGELRCKYVIELLDPIITSIAGPTLPNPPYTLFQASVNAGIPDNMYNTANGWLLDRETNTGIVIGSTGITILPYGNWLVTLDFNVSPNTTTQSLIFAAADIRQNSASPVSLFGGPGSGGTQPYTNQITGNVNGTNSMSCTLFVQSSGIAAINAIIPYFIGNVSAGTCIVMARMVIRCR